MRVDDLFITEDISVLDAMRKLDETGLGVLFVAPEGVLRAVVTDGDIRRYILKSLPLEGPVREAANYSPYALPMEARARAKTALLEHGIGALPLLDKRGRVQDVVFAGGLDIDTHKKACAPVVIMAGGLGTRLYPYTKILPKPLIPIGEMPIVEHIIHRFADVGCSAFTMIDPWSVRREEDAVTVQFGGQAVRAVPYDTPVIGYGMKTVNTLRLWQAEPFQAFDFNLFNAQKYAAAVRERDAAEDISRVLYPNDDTDAGKRLRLKQQYFFSSASLQDMVRAYRAAHGGDFTHFADAYAVQLNDTHPTVAIPELLRLLVEEAGMRFADAVQVAHDTFAYTNHTIMPEALEKWDQKLFRGVLPRVYPYVKKLDALLRRTLEQRGVPMGEVSRYAILEDGMVHMARMAIFSTHSTNGVARLHTEILKDTALHEWYELYPERFNNKTNGVTQRRWLALANPELAALLHDAVGDGWLTDLSQLKRLEPCADDPAFLARFMDVKREKKRQLAAYVEKHEGVRLRADFLLDVQVKRLHEYKRQLLNAFSILDTYYGLKEGRISRADFAPTVYLFGAKAAPGYVRAKGIIKYINELAELVNGDADVNGLMQVVFVQNYNVSYAEKIIPAADVSEQIDPIVCFEIKQHLKHLVEHGSTVIITSHILETIQNLCNKYIIINQGSVVRCGNIEKDNGVDLEQIFIEVVGHEAAE